MICSHIIDATTGFTEFTLETHDAANKKPVINNNNAAPSKIPNFIVCYFSSAFFINISMIYQMDIINEKISKYLPKVPIL